MSADDDRSRQETEQGDAQKDHILVNEVLSILRDQGQPDLIPPSCSKGYVHPDRMDISFAT